MSKSVTSKTPFNTIVRWKADYKPTLAADVPARLIMVKGRAAWVSWLHPEGESLQAVARIALEPVS